MHRSGISPATEVQPLPVALPLEIIAHIISFLAPSSPCASRWESTSGTPSRWSYAEERELRQSQRDLARAARVCRSLLPVVRRLLYSRMTLSSPRTARLLAERLRAERDLDRRERPADEEKGLIVVGAGHLVVPPSLPAHAEHQPLCGDALLDDGRPTVCRGLSGAVPPECATTSGPHDFDDRISPLLQATIFDGRCCVAVQRAHSVPCPPSVAPLRVSRLVQQLYFPHANGVPGSSDDEDDMGQWRCSVRTIFDICAQLRCVSLVIPPEGGVALEELMEVTTQARLRRLEILCTSPTVCLSWSGTPPAHLLRTLTHLHLHNLVPQPLLSHLATDSEPWALQSVRFTGPHPAVELHDLGGEWSLLQRLVAHLDPDESECSTTDTSLSSSPCSSWLRPPSPAWSRQSHLPSMV